jgi:hypothetical protein
MNVVYRRARLWLVETLPSDDVPILGIASGHERSDGAFETPSRVLGCFESPFPICALFGRKSTNHIREMPTSRSCGLRRRRTHGILSVRESRNGTRWRALCVPLLSPLSH